MVNLTLEKQGSGYYSIAMFIGIVGVQDTRNTCMVTS